MHSAICLRNRLSHQGADGSGFDGLAATFGVAAGMLVLLYPMCRWYRTVKAAHPRSVLKYL